MSNVNAFPPGTTTWRIRATGSSVRLNVTLTCDTTAPTVIDDIEAAAAANGIMLERVDGPDVVHQEQR